MPNLKKSSRNKTLTLTPQTEQYYLNKCLKGTRITSSTNLINKTIWGDCQEVLAKIPPASIDLIIADPPYNLSKQFGTKKFSQKQDKKYAEYTTNWLSLTIPLLKSTGSIYICCDWKSSLIIGPIINEKLEIRNRLTWQREKGRGAQRNWKNNLEDIWFATLNKTYTFNIDQVKLRRKVLAPYRKSGQPKDWIESIHGNYRDTYPSNFWDDITIPFWSMSENTAHPTQKPEKLIAKLILASSNPGDLILDPFLGSGTTSVVSKKLKRNFIGIEQEKQFCAWAEKRLELATENSEIQGFKNGIFWERNSIIN